MSLATVRNHTGKGFTIMEVIIVTALMAALAVVAFVAIWGSIGTFRLNTATAKVLSDIRYAQHLARTHNGWYGIKFQTNPTNQYNVYYTDGTTDTSVKNPANPSQDLIINVYSDYGATISAVNIAAGSQVEFNPLGTPYNDKNGSPLAANGTVTVSFGGTNKVIQIIKNTGRTELAYYTPGRGGCKLSRIIKDTGRTELQ